MKPANDESNCVQVTLMGRLGHDFTRRQLANGNSVVNSTLAVTQQVKGGQGAADHQSRNLLLLLLANVWWHAGRASAGAACDALRCCAGMHAVVRACVRALVDAVPAS